MPWNIPNSPLYFFGFFMRHNDLYDFDETWDWRWDMRLKHDMVWLWEEQADNRNVCLKRKEVLLILYYMDKNCWYHFRKEYLDKFSKFAFQEVARPVEQPKRCISWNFNSSADSLCSPKTFRQVLAYTTVEERWTRKI